MTNWMPQLSAGTGPMYVRLAEQIEADIHAGYLPPGTRLPPQRNLAFDLGITVGTIGRAYDVLRTRGLVSGEIGRGTYVLGSTVDAPASNNGSIARPVETKGARLVPALGMSGNAGFQTSGPTFGGTRVLAAPSGTVRLDSSSAPDVGQAKTIQASSAEVAEDAPFGIADYIRESPETWREAGRQWLRRSTWEPAEESIVPTTGARAGILAVAAATTSPGDRIVFEDLTFTSVARALSLFGRQVLPVVRGEEGPVPEALEKICAQQHPKLIFLMPSLHNPTLSAIGAARRREIVEIGRKFGVFIIEDEVYGALRSNALPPFAQLAPDITFHVGSLSKAVAAGLRSGWVSAPPSHVPRVNAAHKMISGGQSYLLGEMSARLVLSGKADELRAQVKRELSKRQAFIANLFGDIEMTSAPDSPFLWLKLPDPWLPGTFKSAAAEAGIFIDDEDEFKCGRHGRVHHRVRIAYTAPRGDNELAEVFGTLKRLLSDLSGVYSSAD